MYQVEASCQEGCLRARRLVLVVAILRILDGDLVLPCIAKHPSQIQIVPIVQSTMRLEVPSASIAVQVLRSCLKMHQYVRFYQQVLQLKRLECSIIS